jgi:hypothetical protein
MSALAFSAYAKLDISKDNDTRLTCKHVVSNSAAVRGIGVSRRLIQGGTNEAHQPKQIRDTRRSDDTCESNAPRRALVAIATAVALGEPIEKKGTTPYVTHFIFKPLMSIDISGLGTATALEAIGTTQNMKGEKMLDKMSAHCTALNVASGDKKYIDGACVLADSDGDKIFSTFDTRDLDKSQPKMDCGTHIITGGTGKYKGITGSEPFACITMPAPAGPGGYFAMDIPHNTTWEIK